MILQAWIAAFIGVAAIVEDLRHRRIPNWISSLAFIAGVGLQSFLHGWRGTGSALLGTITGFSVFLIFYLLGGMGGGDVKLMAGFGALLGVRKLLEAAVWTAACGGILALCLIAASAIRALWMRSRAHRNPAYSFQSGAPTRTEYMPYAPAIAAGVWLSLVPKI